MAAMTQDGFEAAPDTLSEGEARLLLGYLRSAECIVAATGIIEDPFVPMSSIVAPRRRRTSSTM
ncbi:hypothetical protein [Nocardia sp. NPDC004415]